MQDIDKSLMSPFQELSIGQLEFGQVWMSKSTFHCELTTYEDIDRLPLVVLEAPWEEGGQMWVDVAPLWLEPGDATNVDLLLGQHHTTLNRSWAFLLSFQSVISTDQLDFCIGEFTDEGRELFEAARNDTLSETYFGLPLITSQDERLGRVSHLKELLYQMGIFYGLFLENHSTTEPFLNVIGAGATSTASQSLTPFALAAENMGSGSKSFELSLEEATLTGHLFVHFDSNMLMFVVHHARGFNKMVRLIIQSDLLKEPLRSEPFRPESDHEVKVQSSVAVSAWDVDIGLEPIDG
jgi:hypothetical protein